jgi:GPR1/FUN34/yaaH family
MANPAPWAVTAFASTSFMIGIYQTGILNSAGIPIVLPAAFFFGGLVQIIVAIMEFAARERFSAGDVRQRDRTLRGRVQGTHRSAFDLVLQPRDIFGGPAVGDGPERGQAHR